MRTASVRLRDMSDLSFQNFPDGEGGALRRGGAAGQLLRVTSASPAFISARERSSASNRRASCARFSPVI